jgi:dTDP-4-amino-4,6-dideoxygalactose transaminase
LISPANIYTLGPATVRRAADRIVNPLSYFEHRLTMNVPFFDLSRQTRPLRSELGDALMEVVDSQQFVLGPQVERFEREVSEALEVPHAIGVASGSDALLLALMAAGVGPGSEVIVPAFSFFATASAVVRLGARLVFADIVESSFQIDPEDAARRVTPKTRALIAAHLFGDCADMTKIGALGAAHGFPVIEDAAQAFLARHHARFAGTLGYCGCLSFYPTKNLSGLGDGGMVLTHDETAALTIRRLATHGVRDRYEHVALGINSRLDSLQAAALSVRLPRVEGWNLRRAAIARRYSEGLARSVRVPVPAAENAAVFHQYVIRTPDRDRLRSFLAGRGVGTEIYYPIPLHLQPGLAPFCGRPGDFPQAESAARTSLALPIFPELEDREVDYVIEAILEFSSPR